MTQDHPEEKTEGQDQGSQQPGSAGRMEDPEEIDGKKSQKDERGQKQRETELADKQGQWRIRQFQDEEHLQPFMQGVAEGKQGQK